MEGIAERLISDRGETIGWLTLKNVLPIHGLGRAYGDRQLGTIFRTVRDRVEVPEPWFPDFNAAADISHLSRLNLISEVFGQRRLGVDEASVVTCCATVIGNLDPFIQWYLVREIALRQRRAQSDGSSIDDITALMAIRPWDDGQELWNEYTSRFHPSWPLLGPVSVAGRSETLELWVLSQGGWDVRMEAEYRTTPERIAKMGELNWQRLILWKLGAEGYTDLLDDWLGSEAVEQRALAEFDEELVRGDH